MSKRHKPYEGIEWRLIDLRDMQGVENSSVDVIFDKGALDAMVYGPMFSPPKEVKDNVEAYLKEVSFGWACGSFLFRNGCPAQPCVGC